MCASHPPFMLPSGLKCVFIALRPFTDGELKTCVRAGAFGSMAEGQFQRSLHSLDSHQSSARLRGVGAKVRNVGPGRRWARRTFSSLFSFSCVSDTGCQSTSRLCCSSRTRRTWRSWERFCTSCTSTWTAAPPLSMWVFCIIDLPTVLHRWK